jgi:hypothetical protein
MVGKPEVGSDRAARFQEAGLPAYRTCSAGFWCWLIIEFARLAPLECRVNLHPSLHGANAVMTLNAFEFNSLSTSAALPSSSFRTLQGW